MKIFHGITEIAGQMGLLSGALKRKGHIAVGYNTFHSYLGYHDHLLNTNRKAIRKMANHIIDFFDVFHFHYGRSLLSQNADLPIIQAKGKKMIMHHWGNDVRFHDQARVNNPYVYTGDSPPNEKIDQKLRTISRYIHEAIVQDHEVLPYVTSYYEKVHILPIAIDLRLFPPTYPSPTKKRPLVIHAPTNPDFKGTYAIERAIEQLKREYSFDYVRIEKFNHKKAIEKYKEADIIVDQILCGSYGLFSTEAMALGKPVIAYIREDLRSSFPKDLPIVNANPDTVYNQLKYLLTHQELLPKLGQRGRRYVEKYHDVDRVADQLLNIYENL